MPYANDLSPFARSPARQETPFKTSDLIDPRGEIAGTQTTVAGQSTEPVGWAASSDAAIIYPETLNLQAIDVCNSRCVMCNIWKDGHSKGVSLDELRDFLAHPFFAQVQHVGVTGGEPTLRKDLVELYRVLAQSLPKLKGASFITHGMQTDRAVEVYTQIHELYLKQNLTFDGMVSLDGVGSVHDAVRGRAGAFESAARTLLTLRKNGVRAIAACTIVRSNVYGLHDLLDWGKANNVYLRFRVAEFIRRLYNDGCAGEIRNFSARQLRHLVSFFHVLLTEYETDESVRRAYTSILSLLTGGERLVGCPYGSGRAVNVDSRGQVACCAPKGSTFEMQGDPAVVSATLAAQRAEVGRSHCATCIHDYHENWSPAILETNQRSAKLTGEIYGMTEEELTTPELAVEPLDLGRVNELLLVGWYGTETAGDIAILQGIITEYLAANARLRFRVLSLYPAYTRSTISAWPAELRACVKVSDYASDEACEATLSGDAIVMAGGPLMDISETRKILCLFKRFADLGKPRIIEGCGIGPLNRIDYRWNVCRIARLATKISVRDRASRELLRTYGLRKAIDVRMDPAVTFLRAQGIRHGAADAKIIRCFLRELTVEYPQSLTPAQVSETVAIFLTRLLEWYPAHRIELWAMHHFPVGYDDRLFARDLVRKIGNSRLAYDWEPRSPKEIMEAMATADFCICMRFHSCVFAMEVGVPFLALDYTAGGKIRGFLEDRSEEHRLCELGELRGLTKEELESRIQSAGCAEEKFAKPKDSLIAVSKPARVLHLIQSISGGGGARAMIALAKHSQRCGGYVHQMVSLSRAEPAGLILAAQAGVDVLDAPGIRGLREAIAAADVVLVHWWNNPELAALFRRELPAMRLALWLHVGGYHPPQVITRSLIDFADLAVACSPHTYAHPIFSELSEEIRAQRTGMVLAGADFDRLQGLIPRPHPGIRVGYIGTLDPVKMHAEFVSMSCAVDVPDVQFVVCGGGDIRWLTDRAEQLGRRASFEFKGHVEEIREVLETMDVYGYPLCADTYAAAELNLQEVMYAGVPVVAFAHGGITKLIRDGETGILVRTPEAYSRAIEFLCQRPEERARIGSNAAAFARNHWGAQCAAREFNAHFDTLLALPKRERAWGVRLPSTLGRSSDAIDRFPALALFPGARIFIESLGEDGRDFATSLTSRDEPAVLAAEQTISEASSLLASPAAGGIRHYRAAYPKDGFLRLWSGFVLFQERKFSEALGEFNKAIEYGCDESWVGRYIAAATERANELAAQPQPPPANGGTAGTDSLPPLARQFLEVAEAYRRSGDMASCAASIDRAVSLAAGNMTLRKTCAGVLIASGKSESARQYLAEILNRFPGDAEALALNVVAAWQEGRKPLKSAMKRLIASAADRNLDEVANSDGSPCGPMAPAVRELLQSAEEFRSRGNLSSCGTTLGRAQQLAPDHVGLRIAYAGLLLDQKNAAAARLQLAGILQVQPAHLVALALEAAVAWQDRDEDSLNRVMATLVPLGGSRDLLGAETTAPTQKSRPTPTQRILSQEHADVHALTAAGAGWLTEGDSLKLYELGFTSGDIILEIGVNSGRSAVIALKGALSNRTRLEPPIYYGIDADAAEIRKATETVAEHGLGDHAMFFQGDLPGFMERFDAQPSMVFVDGDHRYESVKRDLELLSGCLAPGVPVLVHDFTNPENETGAYGVRRAVDEWERDGLVKFIGVFGVSALVVTTSHVTGRAAATALHSAVCNT